jgi:GNAT superfamily N-acetyltransferase
VLASSLTTLGTVRALLGDGELAAPIVRTFRTGDMGLITARQAILYAESHGWGAPMEALLGEVTAGFLRTFQPGREQCWIAEREGRIAGSIFCVDSGYGRAQLRLLYVEPEARGLHIGETLVRTCVDFARDAGYRSIWLWTHSVLLPARRIYAKAGFTITSTDIHHAFGNPEQGETWELVF